MLLGGNTRWISSGYLADDLTKRGRLAGGEPERFAAERLPGEKIRTGAAAKAERTSGGSLRKPFHDQVIFVGGLNHQQDLEGRDPRYEAAFYAQDQLILELLKAKPDTAVVMAAEPGGDGAWLSRAKALV